jgi:hypothetical protein
MPRLAWWLVLTAVLAPGCPPAPVAPDAGIEDAGASIGPIELCARLSTARCELGIRCYPAFNRLTRQACLDQSQAACLAEYEGLRPSLESGRASLDVERLLSCERRLTSSACPPSFPPEYPLAVTQPFADCGLTTGLLGGAVPAGETCEQPVECRAGTFCVKPDGVCRGTCIAYSKLGSPAASAASGACGATARGART